MMIVWGCFVGFFFFVIIPNPTNTMQLLQAKEQEEKTE